MGILAFSVRTIIVSKQVLVQSIHVQIDFVVRARVPFWSEVKDSLTGLRAPSHQPTKSSGHTLHSVELHTIPSIINSRWLQNSIPAQTRPQHLHARRLAQVGFSAVAIHHRVPLSLRPALDRLFDDPVPQVCLEEPSPSTRVHRQAFSADLLLRQAQACSEARLRAPFSTLK